VQVKSSENEHFEARPRPDFSPDLCLSAASTAFAQASVYGTVSVRRMTDIPYTQGTTSATTVALMPWAARVASFTTSATSAQSGSASMRVNDRIHDSVGIHQL